MDLPFILAGTFGELRSNHFHSALDIKTKGQEGIPVKSYWRWLCFAYKSRSLGLW